MTSKTSKKAPVSKTTPKKTPTPKNSKTIAKNAEDRTKAASKPAPAEPANTTAPATTLADLADGYLAHLETAGKTASTRFFFGYLASVGQISADPARRLRPARTAPPPPRPMPEDDLQTLLAVMAADDTPEARRDHALVRVMAEAGIRVGSAVALDVEDLDLPRGEAHLRTVKGDLRQTVVIPTSLRSHLHDDIGERSSGALFAGQHGCRVSVRHVQRRLAMWQQRAGIEQAKGPHSLRHKFATQLYRQTADLRLVQAALGHRSIASTTIYAQVDRARLADALR